MAADLIEVFAKDLPDFGPFDSYSSHVVVADLDEFLQAVRSWRFALSGRLNLLPTNFAESSNKVYDGLARQLLSVDPDSINSSNHVRRLGFISDFRSVARRGAS